MKYWGFCLWLMIVGSLAFGSPFSLPVSTIIIDAGHGGSDPGAVGIHTEKEINLDLALQTAAILKENTDLEVILTRDDDRFVGLAQRAEMASSVDPGAYFSALLVSIHVNSSANEQACGFEVLVKEAAKQVPFLTIDTPVWQMLRYVHNTSEQLNQQLQQQNRLLALAMQQALASRFPQGRDRGIKEQDLWVLNASKIASVLVEVAFLSNPEEAVLLADPLWRQQMALGIAEGVLAYINRPEFSSVLQ
ncbi:MAG: N-acetylmuramoyl-L-alanine amidase family protein [Sphaerochaetaceae bacterium]